MSELFRWSDTSAVACFFVGLPPAGPPVLPRPCADTSSCFLSSTFPALFFQPFPLYLPQLLLSPVLEVESYENVCEGNTGQRAAHSTSGVNKKCSLRLAKLRTACFHAASATFVLVGLRSHGARSPVILDCNKFFS